MRTATSIAGTEQRCRRGFTLLELLVVLAILAGLTLAVAPRFQGGGARVEFQRALKALAAGLKEQRFEAIRHGSSRRLQVQADPPGWGLEGEAPLQWFPPDTRITDVRRPARPPYRLVFYPDGSASGVVLQFSHRGAGWILDVDPVTGRVRLYPSSGGPES